MFAAVPVEWGTSVLDSWLPRQHPVELDVEGSPVSQRIAIDESRYDVLVKAMDSPLDWDVKLHVRVICVCVLRPALGLCSHRCGNC